VVKVHLGCAFKILLDFSYQELRVKKSGITAAIPLLENNLVKRGGAAHI
jgi:hypothetical protein